MKRILFVLCLSSLSVTAFAQTREKHHFVLEDECITEGKPIPHLPDTRKCCKDLIPRKADDNTADMVCVKKGMPTPTPMPVPDSREDEEPEDDSEMRPTTGKSRGVN